MNIDKNIPIPDNKSKLRPHHSNQHQYQHQNNEFFNDSNNTQRIKLNYKYLENNSINTTNTTTANLIKQQQQQQQQIQQSHSKYPSETINQHEQQHFNSNIGIYMTISKISVKTIKRNFGQIKKKGGNKINF